MELASSSPSALSVAPLHAKLPFPETVLSLSAMATFSPAFLAFRLSFFF